MTLTLKFQGLSEIALEWEGQLTWHKRIWVFHSWPLHWSLCGVDGFRHWYAFDIYLVKHVHYGRSCDLCICGIPEVIFWAGVFRFGMLRALWGHLTQVPNFAKFQYLYFFWPFTCFLINLLTHSWLFGVRTIISFHQILKILVCVSFR